ncbi:condensation domain-containing protein, partial [Undibacterium sp. TS12]|uniref:condensation domain-containing protein n=1 Tax=Undibacterium sp. TS12 TaxID=2908202 RepID=UPI001F4C7390
PPTLSKALDDLARQEGATLFMVLMAAYQTLLSRWSGQDDIVVGTPIAGRHQRELEDLIGFFVNTLVIRSSLQAEQSFLNLLSQVRETALGAYAHQDLPFEKLVEALQPVRDLSRQPIFQAWFVLGRLSEQEALALSDLQLQMIEVEHRVA